MASVLMCGVEDLLLGGSRCVWTLTVTALRRWYAGRLRACRQALRAWCGLGDVYQVGDTCGAASRDVGEGFRLSQQDIGESQLVLRSGSVCDKSCYKGHWAIC